MNLEDVKNLGVGSLKSITRSQRHLTEATSDKAKRENDGPGSANQTVLTVPMYAQVNEKIASETVGKLKFSEEEKGEKTMNQPTIPGLPTGLPVAPPIPGGLPTAPPIPGGLNFNSTTLGVVQDLDIKVIGRISKYGNCGTPSIDTKAAKEYYEENKATQAVLDKLAANKFEFPRVKDDGTEDPTKTERFQVEPKENKYSAGRFRVLFPAKYEDLKNAGTYKVDMSADNVEFYVLSFDRASSAVSDHIIDSGKIVGENTAFFRKNEIFELIKATQKKSFKIATTDNRQAELYLGTSKKTKEGREEIHPTLKVTSGDKAAIKIASLAIPYVALRDRSDKSVNLGDKCINVELFQAHYPGEPIPVHPQLKIEKKNEENAERVAELKASMEVTFDRQDPAVLNALGITEDIYSKLLKPGTASNIKKRLLKEQTQGFRALMESIR